MHKIGKFLSKTFKILCLTILFVGLVISAIIYIKYKPFLDECKHDSKLDVSNSTYETFLTNETSYIFNDNNKILTKLTYDQDSDYLVYKDIPVNVINAFVAIEDRNFWYHNGVDFKGIARVLYRFVLTKGKETHGASTITQQIARRTFLTLDVNLKRKVKEMFYAYEIEQKYSKEEIMEFYINDIYYANQCYGISAASKFYFNKPVTDLTLSQVAYLCAIPNSPKYYDPVINKDNAIPRRDKILNDMYECGFITEKELDEAKNEKIVLDLTGNNIEFSDYQTTYAIKCATEYFMGLNNFNFKYVFKDDKDYKEYWENYNQEYEKAFKQLSSGGYRIYTSLNDEYQTILQMAIDDELAFSQDVSKDNIYDLQGAATLVDNESQKVVAIVGGRSQFENNNKTYSLNRAFQSYRQPGSAIKPLIVYGPALEHGFTPASTVYDINVTTAKQKDVDVMELTGAPYSFRRAVELSKNGCAYYVYYRVNPIVGIKYAQKMNFKKIVPDDYFMSAGLGGLTYGTTTEEMASAYSCFVNNGNYKPSTCIVSILNKEGKELFKDYNQKPVYSKITALTMLDILKGVISNGTAHGNVKWNHNIDIAGKTGTTNENKDGWFCGCSPYFTLAVWVGNDMPKTVDKLQGGTYPTRIWSNVMNEIHIGFDDAYFEKSNFTYYEENILEPVDDNVLN